MPALSEYSNVYNTAIVLLEEAGFQVWFEGVGDAELFWAEREGWDFCSPSPCGLLGLVYIWQHVQPAECSEYWWRAERGGRYPPARRPRPYDSVVRRRPQA